MLHKIIKVKAKENFIIVAKFQNGVNKEYNVRKMMNKFEIFNQLNDINLFKMFKWIKVDVV